MNKRVVIPPDVQFGLIRLCIGCGDKKTWRPGQNVRLDIRDFGQDIVWDVRNGIPLPDNSCDYILSSHFVEHISSTELMDFMNECHRVLRAGCEMYIITPSKDNHRAYIPPHVNRLTEETFRYFDGKRDEESETCTITNESEGKIKFWNITEIVENDRHDLHVKLTPNK